MELESIDNKGVCSFLASRIRAERLKRRHSQAVMARISGIPLRTYKRIELTGTGSIENLIVILRTFERLAAIKLLLPHPETPPRLTIIERVQKLAATEQMKQLGSG